MDFVKAFVCGGLICVLTQILMEKTKLMPFHKTLPNPVSGTYIWIYCITYI